jgi:hypothetical protein
MTHKTNRTNPPARSPREYEEEIAALTVYRDPAALMADLTAEMEAMLVPCAFCLTYPNTEDIGAIHCGEPSCFQTGIPGCGGHWWNFYNECASEFLIARADAALSPKGEAPSPRRAMMSKRKKELLTIEAVLLVLFSLAAYAFGIGFDETFSTATRWACGLTGGLFAFAVGMMGIATTIRIAQEWELE